IAFNVKNRVFQPRRFLSYRRDLGMPPLRLFITPPTDRSVSYSAAKVKVFWAKEGPPLMVPENFASSAAYQTANRTVLGPKKRLGSVARFMLQTKSIRRRRKRQWPKPEKP
ncbi:MAG: hypothetical protein AAB403_15275, partial [Planctomycetota bacterium]